MPAVVPVALLFTCEHGGNEVPQPYKSLFRGASEVLRSHRGWDPGALELSQHMAQDLKVPLFVATVSRLVVELNRSLHHPRLFSEFTRELSATEKQQAIDEFYLPHRQAVQRHIANEIVRGRRVLHIGIHTFTPVLDGAIRTADIGLLYDPARDWERTFCSHWRAQLRCENAGLRVRRNYPYLGTADGFTTYLRTQFPAGRYAGVELEVNQKFPLGPAPAWRQLQGVLARSIAACMNRDRR